MAKIISFIDASIYADSVCDHTVWVATRMSASVEFIHVLGRRDMSAQQANHSGALVANARDILLAELAASDEELAKLSQKRGRLILDHAKDRLVEAGIQDVSTKLRIGDLVETMHEFENDADLIVIGKRGEAADFAKMHLGSNIERVVRASMRPILVSARAFRPINKVLIAFDGGASVTNAVAYLASASVSFGALELHLLTVGEPSRDEADSATRAARELRNAGYSVETRVVPGQADQVIAQTVEAENFDMLVMGAYGHSRIRNLIIGSTTTQMISSCKIPIVLFR